jgi:hypothetical protein
MRRVTCFALTCCICMLCAPLASAKIGPPAPDLRELCERADLIVVGRAVAVRPGGPTTIDENGTSYPAQLMVVELDVERTLKGPPAGPAATFTFSAVTVRALDVGGVAVAAGQFGVFFLREGRGGYEVLEPDFPFVIATPGSPGARGSPFDQAVAQVAHVLETASAPDRLKERAVTVLACSRTPAADRALRVAALSQPLNVRLAAMAVLMARAEVSLLPEVQRLLLSNDARIDRGRSDTVASAMGLGVWDARAIPFLAPLLRSGDVSVRRGAASALRNTRSPKAARPLAQGLYDSDREVQYFAVIGLAEITGTVGEWAPATPTFLQDPQRYLDHWREWAESLK